MTYKANEISEKLIKVLDKDSVTENFFQNEIQKIEKLLDVWKRNIIRVGIIGITSSGKSTLLNVILGADLLPAEVKPTSGVIIGSMKNDKFKVTIHYLDHKKEQIQNYKKAKKKLKTLADEKYNPNNKFNVNQIEIVTPKFNFKYDDLKILDSPGLNACNLESHEKITYEQLLSEIDICIFLTSLKGNADKDDKEILQKIDNSNLEYNKTVIIVQNKLDSVRSKPGRREGISKTKEQVIEECGIRIKLLCEGLKMNPYFCQISAQEALHGRLFNNTKKEKSSRINDFLEIVAESYEKEKIQRDSKRIKQSAQNILDVIKIIDQKIKITKGDLPEIYKEEEENESLRLNYENVYEEFKKLKSNIKNKYNDWLIFINACIEELKNIDKHNISSANKLIKKIKEQTEEIRNTVLDKIKIFRRLLNNLIDEFNLIPEDMDISNQIFEKGSILDLKIEEIIEKVPIKELTGNTIRVAKPGIFNSILRWVPFVNWGTKEEPEYKIVIITKNKINLDKSKQNILNLSGKIFERDNDAIKNFELKFKNQLMEIKNNLDEKYKNISDKKSKIISIDKLAAIKFELNEILDNYDIRKIIEPKIAGEKNSVDKSNPKKNLKLIKYEIPKHILYLNRIAELKTRFVFDRIWNHVLNSESQIKKPILVWGWDYDQVIDFSNRFNFNNKFDINNFKTSGFESETVNNRLIIYIDRNKFSDNKSLKNIISKHKDIGYNVFTLLNISSYGHAEKLIKDDSIHSSLIQDGKNNFNWIYNEFQNEISSDNIEEGSRLFLEFPNMLDCKNNGYFLINDPNPVYSLMFLEYSNIRNESDSIRVQNEILKNNNLKPYINSSVKKISTVISKAFQELNKNKNGK